MNNNRAPGKANIDMAEVNRTEEVLPKDILSVLRMGRSNAWKIIREKLLEEIEADTRLLLTPGKKKLEYTADDLVKMSIIAKERLLNLPQDMENEYINEKKQEKGLDVFE